MPTAISPQGEASEPAKRTWPVERKIDLILEGLRRHRPVTELCREAGISPTRYYRWREQFVDAARTGLVHPETKRRTLEERIQQLEAENARLRQQVHIFQDLCTAD